MSISNNMKYEIPYLMYFLQGRCQISVERMYLKKKCPCLTEIVIKQYKRCYLPIRRPSTLKCHAQRDFAQRSSRKKTYYHQFSQIYEEFKTRAAIKTTGSSGPTVMKEGGHRRLPGPNEFGVCFINLRFQLSSLH